MTQSEIRDRLLELARVRLKNRFGAFEQFRFTLDGLVEGSAILARASLLPAPWIAGFRLGLVEAARQIDAHLLRIIDEWAQREAPAREVHALGGVQPLAAEPQAETPSAAPVVVASASNAPSNGKVWTPERLAEVRAYREKHGTKKTAEHFKVSASLIRQKLPSEKPKPKGYSAFTHRIK